MEINNTSDTLKKWNNFDLKVVFEGVIIGAIIGVIVVAYRMCIGYADEVRSLIYEGLKSKSVLHIIGWFIILILAGLFLGKLVEKVPMSKGSGIPQVKGFLIRQIKLDWVKELIAKFIGGIISLGFGLSLGREGPSVQLGATTGLGFSRIFKRFHLEEKYLVTAGASAGLAAAFNAPLAGVMFAIEELHRNFSPIILMCAMGASITADFITSHFFGLAPVFNFKEVPILPLKYYFYIVILGVIVGVLGKLFNSSLLLLQKYFGQNKKIKTIYKPIIPLLISGVIGLAYPMLLGGGHELIVSLSKGQIVLGVLILLFVLKLSFTVICYCSGVPGGIFLPILVLGAIIGKGFGTVAIDTFGMSPEFGMNLLILGMAAYFTAVVKAPITGSILITEMTGSFNQLLPLILVCMVAYIVTDLINCKPIYESLLENMIEHKDGNWLKESCNNKVVLEIPVTLGSQIEHKRVRNISWPLNCLIVAIKRGDNEVIPNGDFKVYSGDLLIVLTDENTATDLKPKLLAMASETA